MVSRQAMKRVAYPKISRVEMDSGFRSYIAHVNRKSKMNRNETHLPDEVIERYNRTTYVQWWICDIGEIVTERVEAKGV